MRLTLVTSNPGKVAEVRQLLRPFGLTVVWGRQQLLEPQADTLEEVVRAKVRSVRRGSSAVLVEDTGLFIEALNGFPGVYSSYAFRTIGLAGILALVNGQSRIAVFRTVAAVRIGARIVVTRGATRGRIPREPRGTGGFGFDPIFIPNGSNKTFAEMDIEEKNRVSHRGAAIRAIGRALTPGLA